jgi:hypothetical protein
MTVPASFIAIDDMMMESYKYYFKLVHDYQTSTLSTPEISNVAMYLRSRSASRDYFMFVKMMNRLNRHQNPLNSRQ